MSEVNQNSPGRFCWMELGTSDPAAAKKFYGEVFGWTIQETGGGDMEYAMLRLKEREVGGLYELNAEQKSQGIPPHWLSYVAVADADATTEKAKALGGSVLVGPLDVMEYGRMSVLQDPTGAAFAIWQSKSHTGSGVTNEPGALCWNELATNDTGKVGPFYRELFGWGAQELDMPPTGYTLFMVGEQPCAGMLRMTEEWGGAPPHWMPYFAVEDCDATVEKAGSLGAQVHVPPADSPYGRFAMIQDPQGAVFSVIKQAPQQ